MMDYSEARNPIASNLKVIHLHTQRILGAEIEKVQYRGKSHALAAMTAAGAAAEVLGLSVFEVFGAPLPT